MDISDAPDKSTQNQGDLATLVRFFDSFKTTKDGCWVWVKAFRSPRLKDEALFASVKGDTGRSARRYIYGAWFQMSLGRRTQRIRMTCHTQECVNPEHMAVVRLRRRY